MRNLLRRLSSDRRGGLIAEFAAAMPVLVLMLLGGVEVSRFALLNQKMDRLATAMGDLVAQAETLTAAGARSAVPRRRARRMAVRCPGEGQDHHHLDHRIPAGQPAGSARRRSPGNGAPAA